MKLTQEMINRGILKWDAKCKAIEKMGTGIGSKAATMALWREAEPDDDWTKCELHLITLQANGYIEGLRIVGGIIREPIRPRLTEKGYADRALRLDGLK